MSRCTSRAAAEKKITCHLVGSPFHLWDQEAAEIEAQGADIQEWNPEEEDADEEPEIWQPRAPVAEERPSKRRRVERDLPPGFSLSGGSSSAQPKSAALVPSAAVGGNQQVAAFLQNQIKTAFAMTKAIYVSLP